MKHRHYMKLSVAAAMLAGSFWAFPAMAIVAIINPVPSISSGACDNSCAIETIPSSTSSVAGTSASESDTLSSASATTNYGSDTVSASADAGAQASAMSNWADELTITGASGTAGTTGTVNLSAFVNGNVTIGADQAVVTFDLYEDPSATDFTTGNDSLETSLVDPSFTFSTPGSDPGEAYGVSTAFTFTYGTPFVLAGDFGVTVGGGAGTGGSGQTSVAGTWSISQFSLPQGATLTTLSGQPYPPSTVPLPGAAWLFGSGLVGLVGVGFSKRKKQAV